MKARGQSIDSTDYKIEQHGVPKPAVNGTKEAQLNEQVKEALAARDEAKRRLDSLRERETKLLAEIDDLAAQARSGKAGAGRPLVELSGEVGSLRAQLGEAESALATAQRELETASTAERHERFQTLVDAAQTERLAFIEQFRAASLSLGRYCQATGEALEIGNVLMGNLATRLPVQHTLEEILERPDPAAGWLLPGVYEVWRGYGWNANFPVGPVVKIELGEK
jgi:chromosome segregation ATPase